MDRHGLPLITGLRCAGTLSPYFDMAVMDSEFGQWTRATDLFLGDDQRLRDLVMTYGREALGTENNHVAGSAFIIAYLTRLIYPVIAQYVLHRRVLNVRLENLAFHRTNDRIDSTAIITPAFAALPGDPDVSHPDAVKVEDGDALYARFKEWVFTANAELVITALHRATHASVKVSQNAVAAACAQAFHLLYPLVEDPDLVVRDASTLFEDPSSLVYRQVGMEVIEYRGKRGFFARRGGCCLVWRTSRADGYCSNCILRPREQQTQHFQEMVLG
jgi:hypothetical protein